MRRTLPLKSTVVALSLALVAVSTTRAIITPIPITSGSYNADVVVEKTATPVLKVVTTASVDQGTNNGANTWMEAGYDLANPGSGLPAPGTVIVASSNPNYSFQMPPDYTQPNGILINATQVTNGHLKVTTPATYTLLSFLSSGGNGGDVIGVKIYHQDGTIQTGPSFPSPDWFNGTSNVAFVAEGRLGSTVNFTSANINSGNPRLYFRDVPVNNTASVITNIELYYVSGPASSHNDILAVSGATTVGGAVIPVAVTGWTYDFIAEKEAAKRGRVITDVIVDGTNVWATTHSLDGIANTGNSWYEVGYNVNNPDGGGVPIPDVRVATNSGLPVAGSLVTNAIGDRYYQMPADYTVNNAIWIADPTSLTTNAVITLQNPTAASVLSFLASSGGGAVRVDVIITHADASTETNSVVIPDWFNGANPVINANGRVAVDTAQFNNVRGNPQNPRLYGVDFILNNTASPVTTIEVVNTNSGGGRFAILALSGTLDPVLPSFVSNPQSVTVNVGANVQFTASAVANVPITYRWQKGTNGVFVDLTDGGNISGATTTTLSVNNVGDADDAEYRLVATDSAGSANSGVAVLTVLSALTDVTVPTDAVVVYQPNGGSFPGGEAPPNAINDNTTKYLNRGNGANPLNVPVGFTVTPSAGRTIVSALRFYTANDADVRDPANSILEGSKDGGATWTLISSNALTLPAGRNAANLGLDPLTQNIRQLRFNNTNNYSSYRWYTTRVKGATDLMQIGEIEFLGVVDTADPSPFFVTQPTSVVAFNGSSASFNAFASGTPAPSVRWLKGTNGVYVALSDGGSISGSQSGNLSINPVSFGDASDFVCVATNASGSVTSSVVKLTVISTLTDITTPGDPITDFGDQSLGLYAGNPAANAIDNLNSTSHRNGGSGPNTSAGFPPFGGPVGFVVTPSVGSTLVTGLRFYTAADQPELDPANYVLEGSNNGGTSYSPIATGSLTLPLARADNAQIFDPTVQPVQEVLFANNGVYSSYRLTINNVRGPVNDADSMQIGEVELLGVTAVAQPVLSVSISGGQLTISSSINGTLQSATNLTGTIIWVNEGPINGSVNITPAPGTPQKYYRAFYQTP